MPKLDDPESAKAVGLRLRALRKSLSMTMDDMAASIGMNSGRASWYPYELGKNMLPVRRAQALCRLYGVTMDWLYRGLWHIETPPDLAEKLTAAELKLGFALRRNARGNGKPDDSEPGAERWFDAPV
jgi:transcriptional regulator with XRE-family HTH domain